MNSAKRGILLALLSAVLFGASTPFAKLLLGEVNPWLLAGLLYLGSGVGLALVRTVRSFSFSERSEASLKRSDLKWLAAAIFFGGVIGPVLLMVGLLQTSASAATLLLNLEGLATMMIAWIVFRENVDRRLLLGAAAILAGAVVLSWQSGPFTIGIGTIAIAGACLAWGIDNNLTRKISASNPSQITMIKGIVAGAVNVALGFAIGAKLPAWGTAAEAGVVGFFGCGVSLIFFVLGLRYLGSARTGAYFSTAPFVGTLLAVIMLHDPVSSRLVIAAALMAFGLYLHLTEQHRHEHRHEAMEHEHRHVHDEHHQHAHTPNDPPGEPHSHWHRHEPLVHTHAHYPDVHHRHEHPAEGE